MPYKVPFRLDKLFSIIWKNYQIKKKNWCKTVAEVLIPIGFFLLICYYRSRYPNSPLFSQVQQEKNCTTPSSNYDFDFNDTKIYYAPQNDFTEEIIRRVQQKIQINDSCIKDFLDEQILLSYFETRHSSFDSAIAIIFQKSNDSALKLSYKLRGYEANFTNWKTDELYSPKTNPDDGFHYQFQLVYNKLLAIQKAIDISYIEYKLKEQSMPNININMGFLPKSLRKITQEINSFLNLDWLMQVYIYGFTIIWTNVLVNILNEKQSGIKELLRMNGMGRFTMWISWYFYSGVPIVITTTTIVLLLKIPLFGVEYLILPFSNFAWIALFSLLYCSSTLCLTLLFSTFFHKVTYATIGWTLLSILPYTFCSHYNVFDSLDFSFARLPLYFFPNTLLSYSFKIIYIYEQAQTGVSTSNLFHNPTDGDFELSFGMVLVFFALQSLLYFFATAYYFDRIDKSLYGQSKSFWFPLKDALQYYREKHSKKIASNNSNNYQTDSEDTTENGKNAKGIIFDKIHKKIDKTIILDNLSMKVPKNKITVLLGLNGTGKTTAMMILTGIDTSTSGDILNDNKSIFENMNQFQQKLGICPQHNLHFPHLTVFEHLIFFGKFKGLSYEKAEAQAIEYLQKLNIYKMRNKYSHQLSGGMKRKLSLAIALMGNPEILILDEPTSGLDIKSCRHFWNMLRKIKEDLTILIITHSMEEADSLADHIVIMANGENVCEGTPFEIKRKFDVAYFIKVRFLNEAAKNKIINLLPKYFSILDIAENIAESDILITVHYKDEINLQKALKDLEVNKEKYKIKDISLKSNSIEYLYFKAILVSNKETKSLPRSNDISRRINKILDEEHKYYKTNNIDIKLISLFYKRWCLLKRNFLKFVFLALLCCILIFLTWLGELNIYKPTKLTMESYKNSIIFYNSTDDMMNISNVFVQVAERFHSQAQNTNNVVQDILNEAVYNYEKFKHRLITGLEFTSHNISNGFDMNVWFSTNPYHSVVVTLNLVTNALGRIFINEKFFVEIFHHPLPNHWQKDHLHINEDEEMLNWKMLIPLGFLLFYGNFIFAAFYDMSSKFYLIQMMALRKMNRLRAYLFYWACMFIFDLVLCNLFLILIFFIYEFFLTFLSYHLKPLFTIFLAYTLSILPMAYFFSRRRYYFDLLSTFSIFYSLTGPMLPELILYLNESIENILSIKIGYFFKIFFLILSPQFGLVFNGITYSKKVIAASNWNALSPEEQVHFCKAHCYSNNPCCADPESNECFLYKTPNNVTEDMLLMFCGFFVYFFLIIFNDCYLKETVRLMRGIKYFIYNIFKKIKYFMGIIFNSYKTKKNKIPKMHEERNVFHVQNIQKSYGNKQIINLTFDATKGKCLALLGVNGAGKTTLSEVITQEVLPESGHIYHNKFKNYLPHIGYCPQMDYLNYQLNPYETLKVIALLRGYKNVEEEVEFFLTSLDFYQYRNVQCNLLSGGNKRKLCIAMSLIGLPEIILLDEPTNGLDPISRYYFNRLIKNIKKKRIVILTSHNVDECEQICDDGIIIKKNQTKNQVNNHTIKDSAKNSGYNIKMKKRISTKIDDFEFIHFIGNISVYKQKANRSKKLYEIVEMCQELKESNKIEDYEINKSSWEEEFMRVTKEDNNDQDTEITLWLIYLVVAFVIFFLVIWILINLTTGYSNKLMITTLAQLINKNFCANFTYTFSWNQVMIQF